MIVIYFITFFFNSFNSSTFLEEPKTYVTSPEILRENKEKIGRGESNLSKARNELINKANAILSNKIVYSITNKRELPPSKSKHDFYSLAPYWWPDSSKPNGIPYMRKDGEINPEVKELRDADMVGKVSSDIYTLGLAYYFSKDEKYVDRINDLIYDFFIDSNTRMNPHFRFAQMIKGHDFRGSITISAFSFVNLIEGVQLVLNSKNLNRKHYTELKKWFSEFLLWMENDQYAMADAKAKNNIGVYFAVQKIVYYLFTGDAVTAKKLLRIETQRIVDEQISTNGELRAELNRAKPWSYVNYTFRAFDHLIQLSETLSLDILSYTNQHGGSIDKMYKWIVPYAQGKKGWQFSKERVTQNQFHKALLKYNSININTVSFERNISFSYVDALTNRIY